MIHLAGLLTDHHRIPNGNLDENAVHNIESIYKWNQMVVKCILSLLWAKKMV
jgi:hypothetical protein